MQTIRYNPNQSLTKQMRAMVDKTKAMYTTGIHLGKAYSVPIRFVSLLEFKNRILFQFMEKVKYETRKC